MPTWMPSAATTLFDNLTRRRTALEAKALLLVVGCVGRFPVELDQTPSGSVHDYGCFDGGI
jgi:hypothetical protein